MQSVEITILAGGRQPIYKTVTLDSGPILTKIFIPVDLSGTASNATFGTTMHLTL